MNNSLSKTRLKFTKDRIQHYSQEARECSGCGHTYFPKVHSQPYIVQFSAILMGVTIFVIFKIGAPNWLYLALPIPILFWMIAYYRKDRKLVSPRMRKVKYGEIIIECPECDGDKP